jgi:GYF domain 2
VAGRYSRISASFFRLDFDRSGRKISKMVYYACKADGTSLGEFDETVFREKIRSGELKADDYYWCEGMADWKPVSEYRAPGKVTTIIQNLPARKAALRQAAPVKARNTPLDRLKNLFGGQRAKRDGQSGKG